MSTNTTNTSEHPGMDSPAPDSRKAEPDFAKGERAGSYESLGNPMARLPDPAVIARLASELYAPLPVAPASPPAPPSHSSSSLPGVDLAGATGQVPQAAVPDYPREMFSFPAPPNLGKVSGLSQRPAPLPAAHLQEDDFRAIAASLAQELSFAPSLSPAIPPLKSAAPSLDGEGSGFRNAGAEFPLGGERFSFPGAPSMTSVPPTGPPGGSDLAAVKELPGFTSSPDAVVPPAAYRGPVDSAPEARNDPWSAAPNFPEQEQIFAFPRVPGISLSSAPEPAVAQPVTGDRRRRSRR
jgi:hypothetical protein